MSDKIKDKDLEDDYSAARQNYHYLIEQMINDIESYREIAKETEHPRSFEVLFNGYKIAAEMNDKLLEHQQRAQAIEDKKNRKVAPLIDGAVYTGSIADLQRQKKLKEENKNDRAPESAQLKDLSRQH